MVKQSGWRLEPEITSDQVCLTCVQTLAAGGLTLRRPVDAVLMVDFCAERQYPMAHRRQVQEFEDQARDDLDDRHEGYWLSKSWYKSGS